MSSTNMYHQCGYPLIMESIKEGNKFIAEFYDPAIKECAAKVTACPCCNLKLGEQVRANASIWSKSCLNHSY